VQVTYKANSKAHGGDSLIVLAETSIAWSEAQLAWKCLLMPNFFGGQFWPVM